MFFIQKDIEITKYIMKNLWLFVKQFLYSRNRIVLKKIRIWKPYKLFLDPKDILTSSHLGNNVYAYKGYTELVASNPISSNKGSCIFWISSSVDIGSFTLLRSADPYFAGIAPQLSVSPNLTDFDVYLPNSTYTSSKQSIPYNEWGLVVLTQNDFKYKIYQQSSLAFEGSASNLTGSFKIFLPDYNLANIAFTNEEITENQVKNLHKATVLGNYTKVLGYTPEAYYKSAPISGSIPNERY